MYSLIKEQVKTVEEVQIMSSQDLYYAYKWMEEGSLEVTKEVASELVNQMCLRGI